MNKIVVYSALFLILGMGCAPKPTEERSQKTPTLENVLDYRVTPKDKFDKSGLMFSDQGAWFASSFHKEAGESFGFSGPFLMTQENGVWLATSFVSFSFPNTETVQGPYNMRQKSYASHLEQDFLLASGIRASLKLLYANSGSSLICLTLENTSEKDFSEELVVGNSPIVAAGIHLETADNELHVFSKHSKAVGKLRFPSAFELSADSTSYKAVASVNLPVGQRLQYVIAQQFEFGNSPELPLDLSPLNFNRLLTERVEEKAVIQRTLVNNLRTEFTDTIYQSLVQKAVLTLQNNWRVPAGEIKHEGLFPSYHYKWFHGFWAWDSWKHAVGLAYYDTRLAKEQIALMFDFQEENGFIPDCLFRDTTIEKHNYRDTKPPLAAWAVYEVYKRDGDKSFLEQMYPKLLKYHQWWYADRDHDADGLCEYGSTDGSLVAAKWESGMDNAIRFDGTAMLRNSEKAYSMNQESVDLNAFLYAEKMYLLELAEALGKESEVSRLFAEAQVLKNQIRTQFFDAEEGWFYDTTLDGKKFIKGEGSEGWLPLWAKVVTEDQAAKVKLKMLNPDKFYTRVPFQTMSADHKKFNPLKGYWRGPNWLDQAFFAIRGLRNYGFEQEADAALVKLLNGANGMLEKGPSIRENYHPITGAGLNAKNFSWSAAHVLMMLQKEE